MEAAGIPAASVFIACQPVAPGPPCDDGNLVWPIHVIRLMRFAALVVLLLLFCIQSRASAQEPPPVQAMPDSTYLRLTMELPEFGSFVVRRTQPVRGGERVQLIQQHIMSFELIGCVMQWRYSRRVDDGRRLGRPMYFQISVPLKEIDLRHLEARPTNLTGNSVPDPQHWQVMLFSAKRSARPFVVKNLDHAMQRGERMLSIEVYGQENARLVATLLADAAQRCDSWNTAPLRPIR